MIMKSFENEVRNLIETDARDELDRSWLLASYLSLRTAEELGYKHYDFARLAHSEETSALLNILSEPLLQAPQSEHSRMWMGGHFFNSAILRMVALAEIRLKLLYAKKTDKKGKYWDLVPWYESTYADKLTYLGKARKHINEFKHEPDKPDHKYSFGDFEDGVQAFRELLLLLRRTIEA